jgi:hypothetical protein
MAYKVFTSATAALLVFVGSGRISEALSPMVGLKICDLTSGDEISIQSTKFREVVVAGEREEGQFWTITRGDGGLVFRQRSSVGDILEERSLPLLTEGFAYRPWCAVSPSAQYLAFVDREKHTVDVMDFASHGRRTLSTNVVTSAAGVLLLRWLSPADVVIVTYRIVEGRRQSCVARLNIERGVTGSYTGEFEYGHSMVALSGDGTRLALIASDNRSGVMVVDLTDMTVSGGLARSQYAASIGSVCWLADGKGLVYTCREGGAIYTSGGPGEGAKCIVAGGAGCSRFVVSAAGGWVFYKERKGRPGDEYLCYAVSDDGQKRICLGVVNGGAFGLGKSGRVVLEVGY